MADRWKLGNYTFLINPNKYAEQVTLIGDTIVTLDGTVISQPTSAKEEYSISSVFYQNRPRVLQQVSVANLSGIKIVNGKFYVLNNTTKKVDVYTSNFTLSKSIVIDSTPTSQENFIAFDVMSDETIYALQSTAPDILWKVVGTTVTQTAFPSSVKTLQGIKYYNGYFYAVNSDGMLFQLSTSLSVVNSVQLPYISPNISGYNGMDIVNGYLVVSFTADDISGAYHIDPNTGNIVNVFSLPDYISVSDVTFDGSNYIFSTSTGNQIIYTNGNTVALDVYNLEKEIKTKGFIDMIDDMGVKRRIAVTQYSFDRQDGSLLKYNVDISGIKVDRGVN